jgi:hypothetical protein
MRTENDKIKNDLKSWQDKYDSLSSEFKLLRDKQGASEEIIS